MTVRRVKEEQLDLLLPFLSLAALLASIAAVLWLRSLPHAGTVIHRRYNRPLARALVLTAAVATAASPFEQARELLGFGLAPQCTAKPEPILERGVRATEEEALKAELQGRAMERIQEGHPSVESVDTTRLSRVTGPGGPNFTDQRFGVYGTDLGHPFVLDGRLGLIFGDTFGNADRDGWRSNTLAWVEHTDGESLLVTDMRTNPRGTAVEILGSMHLRGWEQTVIPTYATTAGDSVVVHYMSVHCWGIPGTWVTNHSGLAVSRDGGQSFQRVLDARFAADSGFAQVAFVEDGDHRYVFGIPAARSGPARLARVETERLTDLAAWEYWDGQAWVDEEAAAAPIVPAPVGELSVQYNPHHREWVMLYLHEARRGVVLRTAASLTGPWSAPELVASAVDYPELYAPYLLPEPARDGTVYFTMSRYDIYNVLLMRTTLQESDRRATGR